MKETKLANELAEFYNNLCNGLEDLHNAMENDDEDMVATCFGDIPSAKAVLTAAHKYAKLMENRPRKKAKKEAADG